MLTNDTTNKLKLSKINTKVFATNYLQASSSQILK